MEMREFLMSLSDKVNAAREGTDMIDERAMREMPEARPIDFGAFSFIPDISISGGRTTSMGGEEGNTRFVEDGLCVDTKQKKKPESSDSFIIYEKY